MSTNNSSVKVEVKDNFLRLHLWTAIVSSIICVVLLLMVNSKSQKRVQLRSEFSSVLVK